MHLTKATIERAKLPPSSKREYFLRDRGVRGLAVRVTENGAKSFVFEGRIRGRVRRLTIGGWPELNLVLARERAIEIRRQIALGQDPAQDKVDARAEATFSSLVDAYMERHAKPHKRSADQDADALRLYIPAGWRTRRLSDISRADVLKLHGQVGRRGHYAANRLLALLKTMFALAKTWEMLDGDNPAHGIKQFREEKRERYLSADELARINTALLAETDWRWKAYFPLALMLGCRRSELLSAKWADVDLGRRTLTLPMTKAGRSHLLPLPDAAIALLEALPSRSQSEFVFPGVGVSHHLQEPKKAWARICERADIENCRVHDLRHALASLLVQQG
jgi:integrase